METPDFKVIQIPTPFISQYSYLICSGGEAAIIDPTRQVDLYPPLLSKEGLKLKYIALTHTHADFVATPAAVSRTCGGRIVAATCSPYDGDFDRVNDNTELQIGKVRLQCLETPGHTPDSLSFLLRDASGKAVCIFTGDTLFVGEVGRPDLAAGAGGPAAAAAALRASLRKIGAFEDDVFVFPGHGAGSACGRRIEPGSSTTIGQQRKHNFAFSEASDEEFVRWVTSDLPTPPRRFFHDARLNKVDSTPEASTIVRESRRPIDAATFGWLASNRGVTVIDTRRLDVFEKGFIRRSICVPLEGSFDFLASTFLPPEPPILLVSEPGTEEEVILRLALLGYDNVLGYLDGGIKAWPGQLFTVPSVEAANVHHELETPGIHLIDLRGKHEKEAEVENCLKIPAAELKDSLYKLNRKEKYLAMCQTGPRAVNAAEILNSNGFNAKFVRGGFQQVATNANLANKIIKLVKKCL